MADQVGLIVLTQVHKPHANAANIYNTNLDSFESYMLHHLKIYLGNFEGVRTILTLLFI